MKLSIVVTHYNEPWSTCRPLFDSIALQQGINFEDIEVLVVEDGRENNLNDANLLFGYKYEITHLIKKHEGVSSARNFGLDHAKGDYVMFCDCDDMFLNSYGIYLLMSGMNEGKDMIYGCFVEEVKDEDGNVTLSRHDKDVTFVHGKAFRRQYLIDENIRFDPSLTIHEDSYFVFLASACSDSKSEISTPFYLWKWNENSTVRKDPTDYVLKTYEHVMRNRIALCRQLNERGQADNFQNMVCKTIIDSYYDANKPEWLKPENAELVKKAEKAFKEFYLEFGQDYLECNINRIAEMMYVCRAKAFQSGLRCEQITIADWIKKVCT